MKRRLPSDIDAHIVEDTAAEVRDGADSDGAPGRPEWEQAIENQLALHPHLQALTHQPDVDVDDLAELMVEAGDADTVEYPINPEFAVDHLLDGERVRMGASPAIDARDDTPRVPSHSS